MPTPNPASVDVAPATSMLHIPDSVGDGCDVQQTPAGDFVFRWLANGVTIEARRVREGRRSIEAELTIRNSAEGVLAWGGVTLGSIAGRDVLIKRLPKGAGSPPWHRMFDYIGRTITAKVRATDPAVLARPRPRTITERYLYPPLVVEGVANEWHGDRGHMKTYTALAMVTSLRTGAPMGSRLRPERPGPAVLWVDAERNGQAAFEDRLHHLIRGGMPEPMELYYKPLRSSVMDEYDNLLDTITQKHIGLVVYDSWGFLLGGDMNEQRDVTAAMTCINALPGTALILNHVSAVSQGQTSGYVRPIGSVFFEAGTRNGWFLKRAADLGTPSVTVAYYNGKNTDGPLHPPFALRFTFGPNGAVRITDADVADAGDLLLHVPLTLRIIDALRRGGRTVKDLAEACQESEGEVRARLARELRGRVMEIGKQGREKVWALVEHRQGSAP